jgi:GT2 family glycosyltransferase/glycosyltransferase involved in cell wall biosynthesis
VRSAAIDVSIIIPVLNKLEFTAQCLDRIWRNTGSQIACEVVVVDNASSDGTQEWFARLRQGSGGQARLDHGAGGQGDTAGVPAPVRYLRNETNHGFARANNEGARLSSGRYLLFLNNDTLVQPGWLAEMLAAARDPSVGIVGIKQLFPYTNEVYHTGIVFTPARQPEHLYPHLDASRPEVNKQREYQAVNGACLLIPRDLFDACGGFDEEYRNGYEDIDLCMKVRQRGRTIVCCTRGFIYHYGQISEGRTADDEQNSAIFQRKWGAGIVPDRDGYLARDRADRRPPPSRAEPRRLPADAIYLADRLDQGSALTWINAELAVALADLGAPVFVNGERPLSKTLSKELGHRLTSLAIPDPPLGGVQIKWSHYWPQHLNLELAGDVDLEFFVINYLFGRPNSEPWDYWLQTLRQNDAGKLALSEFCESVLLQVGVPQRQCHVWHPGYSPEIRDVGPPPGPRSRFRFLTVTNSHDLGRYNTLAVLDAFAGAFTPADDVTLVIKDYGASSGDTSLRQAIERHPDRASIEYVTTFTSKRDLIALYRSCDAFVSAHRGEGFGMKILDAMACGLPVVTPLFGGPTAYCGPGNCFAVDFALAPVGDCLDTRSLQITNQPLWAEVEVASLQRELQRVYGDAAGRALIARRGQETVIDGFSWKSAANRLLAISGTVCQRAGAAPRPAEAPAAAPSERSPYWLGLRMSVIIPTHNRKDKLLACLDALARQSVLPQEYEVIVADDGSTDGTEEAVRSQAWPFALRYFRQEPSGPGAARNRAVQAAAGELVLFIGDDILADERLIEEHLLAHAHGGREPGLAVLGHIDWPPSMAPNEVMDYVCGDAMLQFAFPLIRQLPELDHRFFYTSNISLRRQFLLDAAAAGIAFDPAFRHAAFEDSELAFRLMPRGLRIRYAEGARVWHDHWMDLESFSRREFRAGQMAVVFYRKHPGHDDQLLVRRIADLVAPAAALRQDADALRHVEAFDAQTDTLLQSFAGSLSELLAMVRRGGAASIQALPEAQLRSALHGVLRVIFDVHRTRGKVLEWYSGVEDPRAHQAAQSLAAMQRKLEFLQLVAADRGPLQQLGGVDSSVVSGISARMLQRDAPASGSGALPMRARAARSVRRALARPSVVSGLIRADRYIQTRLQTRAAWLTRYQRVRSRLRQGFF